MSSSGVDSSSQREALASSVEPDLSLDHAEALDEQDPLSRFRSQFLIPSKADLHRTTLKPSADEGPSTSSIYLCGNSLGVQPVQTAAYIQSFLTQWRTKGVEGHFTDHADSPVAPFLHTDDQAAKLMAPLVGGLESEVAVMSTLTVNLHLLMASFFKPSRPGEGRYKIMLEGKAFPSDHFAVQSQLVHHGLDPSEAMVLLEPSDPQFPTLETQEILDAITQHSSELALILLPGIQFYTGQYLDIPTITAHARKHDIVIGWDLAHAAGNVELKLHDWDVDFAAWCTYKYMNCGPGASGAIFVHERHGHVDVDDTTNPPTLKYRPRLSGWWGDKKIGRFNMTNVFDPREGAAGFQVSNNSALDFAAVIASLDIFKQTSISELRARSIRLTKYLEQQLDDIVSKQGPLFAVITPRDPAQRGAQLSVRLKHGWLDTVLAHFADQAVVIDERKPDVVRVAPAPLYNSYQDIWHFRQIFEAALLKAAEANGAPGRR